MTDTLPEAWLLKRSDEDWETQQSTQRIDAARAFALPVMTRIFAVQELWHPDVQTDDDFSALVDQLYDGVRDRLTRQDLVAAFIDPLNPLAHKQAERIIAQSQREVRRLTEPDRDRK